MPPAPRRSHFGRRAFTIGATVTDEPRLLRRGALAGYTSSPFLAVRSEPEAFDVGSQERFTREAHRRAAHQEQAAWATGRRLIVDGLSVVRASRPSRQVLNDLRVVQRVVERLDQRLGAG
jgi:hypothetical protein